MATLLIAKDLGSAKIKISKTDLCCDIACEKDIVSSAPCTSKNDKYDSKYIHDLKLCCVEHLHACDFQAVVSQPHCLPHDSVGIQLNSAQ